LEEVAVHVGYEVWMEVDDNSVLTRSTRDIMSMARAPVHLSNIMIVIIYTLIKYDLNTLIN
jgi:hypothetical protein